MGSVSEYKLVVGDVLPGVPRSCLALGKAKDFFQNSKQGYETHEWEYSLGLLGRLKWVQRAMGGDFFAVPRTTLAPGKAARAVGPSVELGDGGEGCLSSFLKGMISVSYWWCGRSVCYIEE